MITKVVLRPDGSKHANDDTTANWDFLCHQSGIIGTAILFQNADSGPALQQFPAEDINSTSAVSFVASGDPNTADASLQTRAAPKQVNPGALREMDLKNRDPTLNLKRLIRDNSQNLADMGSRTLVTRRIPKMTDRV